jgi:hypothetical protein
VTGSRCSPIGVGRRRLVGAVLAAVLVGPGLLLSSEAPAATPSEPLVKVVAAAASSLRSSSAVHMELQGARIGGVAPAPVSGRGAFDFAKSTGEIDLEVPAPGGASAVHRTLFLPTVVFVRPPSPRAASLPAGKDWIIATLDRIESNSTNFPQFVLQEEGLSPLLELRQLFWGAVSAKVIAPRQLDGVSVPGFQVGVDLRKAAVIATRSNPALALAIRTELVGLGTAHSASGSSVIAERIWLRDGKVAVIQLSPPGAGIGVTTTTLTRYGTRVSVGIPDLATVVDIAALTPAGEQESGPESDVA